MFDHRGIMRSPVNVKWKFNSDKNVKIYITVQDIQIRQVRRIDK